MRIKMPHTLVLLFSMMICAQILTYILPAGTFSTTEIDGREVIISGTYQIIKESEKLSLWSIFTVLPRAFADSQAIIFFIFIIGGSLAVIKSTGAIDAAIGKMLEVFGTRPSILVFLCMFIFAAGSASLGMAEEYLPFVPLLITLCLALRLDTMSAIGIMVVGYGTGYGVAMINPFTVMIAQGVAGLKPVSGWWYRLVLFLPFFMVGWWYVHRYVQQIIKNPEKGYYAQNGRQEEVVYPLINRRHKIILWLTLLALILIVYGISDFSGWHWYITELGAVFMALALIVILIAGINPNKAAISFAEGATELASTALLIGFARSIALILEDGMVLHTIIHYASIPLQKTGPEVAAVGMYAIQSIFNFFVPSGSGQAFVTIPLLAPIGDLTGVSRQIVVLAYQFGDGFTNMIVPTNAVLMGILGIAGIPYDKWFRFILPVMIRFWLLGSLALMVAVWIGYN
ncbi:MAG: YfcC family protein [Cyclobacteriaceae bacterium]|nr:YfcC family protein [Cyclobacteriaceae bacterium]